MQILPRPSDDVAEGFRRNLQIINHFRSHIRLFADADVLELLRTFCFDDFTNEQARAIFGTKRIATYNRLSQLVELGLLERHGRTYRASPYARELTRATAAMLKGLLTGRLVAEDSVPFRELLKLAKEGADLMYARGRIQDSEHRHYISLVKGFEEQLDSAPLASQPSEPSRWESRKMG